MGPPPLRRLLMCLPTALPGPALATARQVAEVSAQNEYQLKLKELALNERVRELTDKAASEAAAAAQR